MDRGQDTICPAAVFIDCSKGREVAMADLPLNMTAPELMALVAKLREDLEAKGVLVVLDAMLHKLDVATKTKNTREAVFTFIATEWGFKEVTVTPYQRLMGKIQLLEREQDPAGLLLMDSLFKVR
jgi:hypothetical protein